MRCWRSKRKLKEEPSIKNSVGIPTEVVNLIEDIECSMDKIEEHPRRSDLIVRSNVKLKIF